MPIDLTDARDRARRGDLEPARLACESALAEDPNRADARRLLGQVARSLGDLDAARAHLEAAARLDPADPDARLELASLRLDLGDPASAVTAASEALRLRPDSAEGLTLLGNGLGLLGRSAAAETCLRQAARLRPDLPAAHAGLAGLLEQRGDFEGSVDALRRALGLDPRHPGALARLATRLRGELPEADRRAIEALLAEEALPPEARIPLLFGLAHVEDALGRFDRAASLATEANALQAEGLRRRGRAYDPEGYRRLVDGLIAGFTPEFFDRIKGWGSDSRRPVFVVGLPRSGTTLVEQVLAAHPRVHAAGELDSIRLAFRELSRLTGDPPTLAECLARVGPAELGRLAEGYLADLRGLDKRADRVVDKMPENYVYLGLISALFPKAAVVHVRREPRDVALSCWLTHFGQVRWASDADHIAARVAGHRRLMEHWRRVLPRPPLEVEYEALVADPEPAARALIERVGLPWDDACLAPHEAPGSVRTASLAQVRRPIHARSVGRWKGYAGPLAGLFQAVEAAGA